MVFPSEYGDMSKYSPGPMLINFVDQTNVVNHYTTPDRLSSNTLLLVFGN